MEKETAVQIEMRLWKAKRLEDHRWRLANWETVKKFWIPQGLTCPQCGADYCEIDGHSC